MSLLKKASVAIFYQIGNLPTTRFLMKRFRGNVSILMYHRILPAEEITKVKSPIAKLNVSVNRFEEHIKFLTDNYDVISMDDIHYELNNYKKHRIVLTFDDGYKDILLYALPILKKYNVPATIYIATRFPEGDCSVWWHEISDICESRLSIEFSWQGQLYYRDLTSRKQKQRCFQDLKSLIMKLPLNEQMNLIHSLRNGESAKNYREFFLTWEEIQQLDKDPLITIGAHTHNHVNLKVYSIEEAKYEILQGKKLLEEKLRHAIENFAYPYGGLNEADEREYNLARECGFKTSVTTLCQPMDKKNDLYCLPRIEIFNNDDSFKLDVKLSGWNAFLRNNI